MSEAIRPLVVVLATCALGWVAAMAVVFGGGWLAGRPHRKAVRDAAEVRLVEEDLVSTMERSEPGKASLLKDPYRYAKLYGVTEDEVREEVARMRRSNGASGE